MTQTLFENAIEAAGLVKHYGEVQALDGLDLTVEAGTVFGLLGPNGAGKSTTVRILTTLSTPDSGSATVAERPTRRKAGAIAWRRDSDSDSRSPLLPAAKAWISSTTTVERLANRVKLSS